MQNSFPTDIRPNSEVYGYLGLDRKDSTVSIYKNVLQIRTLEE